MRRQDIILLLSNIADLGNTIVLLNYGSHCGSVIESEKLI